MALVDDIEKLYISYFNRPADPGGLAYWTDQANRNGGTGAIANAFSASAEYQAAYAGLGSTAIVNKVYQNLFGRPAEPAGLQAWSALLDTGTLNVGNIVTAIFSGARNADAVAVANKALAAVQFTQALTTPGQVGAYTTSRAAALAMDWLKQVLDPATLATALAGLQPVIGAITAAPASAPSPAPAPAPAQNQTLAAGPEASTGGSDDNTFTGTVAGAFATGDSIDGGGGNDTLTVTDPGAIDTTGTTVVSVETATLTAGAALTANTTGWTGLTSLSGSAVGAATLTASGATSVSFTETGAGQGAGAIAINGGKDVTVTSSHNTGGSITIGATTAPTGAVVVNSAVDQAGATHGAIAVTGGTTVSVTQAAGNAANTTTTMGNVTVTGTAATTSVTVVQPSAAAAQATVAAVAGVAAVTAATAAPGTRGVTAATAVNAVSAQTAAAGVNLGTVAIQDAQYGTTNPNSIATVSLTGWGDGSTIRSNALATLSLSGTAGSVGSNGGLTVSYSDAGTHTLALNLNGVRGQAPSLTVGAGTVNVMNVVTSGADSLLSITDTGLTTLNLSGTQVLALGNTSIPGALTAITVSGGAGFNDNNGNNATKGFAALHGAATFTTTSSGAITLALDSATQSFTGSTGKDTITISSTTDAAQTITGGSGSTDELVLHGGAYALTAATGTKVTGFETLGVASSVTGTINMALLATGFTGLHVLSGAAISFSNVAAGTATLSLDAGAGAVSYTLATTTGGPTSTLAVNLGNALTDSGTFGALNLNDSGSLGVGTVSVASNGLNFTPGDAVANFNTLTGLADSVGTLNVSGTQGLAITTASQSANQTTAVTINNSNTSSYGLSIGILTDSLLTSLTFAGTGLTQIGRFSVSSSLTLNNTGTQTAKAFTTSGFTLSSLTSLTLTGNVQVGANQAAASDFTFGGANSVTLSGSTDHARVALTLGAAATGNTHTVNLGNGNNAITDNTIAGTVNMTVGTGSNLLTLGGSTNNTSGIYNLTLGAHTLASGPDYVNVGTSGNQYALAAANYTVTGAATGDRIIFRADNTATLVPTGGATDGTIVLTGAGADEAGTINALITAVGTRAHAVAYAQFGGNTYVAESLSTTASGADDSIVKLVGLHTLTAGTAGAGNYALLTS